MDVLIGEHQGDILNVLMIGEEVALGELSVGEELEYAAWDNVVFVLAFVLCKARAAFGAGPSWVSSARCCSCFLLIIQY